MNVFFSLLATVAAVLFVGGFFGHLHPLLDSIAIGRWVSAYAFLAFVFLHAAFSGRKGRAIFLVGIIAVIGGLHRMGPGGEDGPVRVYTKNLLFRNADMAPIVADIRAANPDVVVLQEISSHNRYVLDELQTFLPHIAVCPWQGWNGMAILSRWPMESDQTRCSNDRSLMASKIIGPSDDFWMISAHLQHPWPDIQWPLLERSLPVMQNLDAPVIVAGDFNTMYWTAAARKVGAMTNTQPIRTKAPTFFLWNVGLHLDQVWAAHGRAHVRPRFGSDHRGIVADVWYEAISQ